MCNTLHFKLYLIGYYCPYSRNETECPLYTYNDLSEATNATWCKDCPPGYFCDDVAIANYSRFPCPAGYYCELASNEPVPCPGGTYR